MPKYVIEKSRDKIESLIEILRNILGPHSRLELKIQPDAAHTAEISMEGSKVLAQVQFPLTIQIVQKPDKIELTFSPDIIAGLKWVNAKVNYVSVKPDQIYVELAGMMPDVEIQVNS